MPLYISRENIEMEIKRNEGGEVELRELIDSSMLILSESSNESNLNNFKSIKFLFDEVTDMKENMNNLEYRVNI